MPYKQSATSCVVRLVPLRSLSPSVLAHCQSLRQEAGRLWTDLLCLHADARAQRQWLTVGDLEQATKGGQYALHSQSVQALCQEFAANVATATELRQQEVAESGHPQTQYPHHEKLYQTVVWKDQALLLDRPGLLGLKNGQGRPPLYLPLPGEYVGANLRRVELTWRADHYEVCLTLDSGEPLPPVQEGGAIAGIDLGEVHIAAATTTRRHALIISGRLLRACKQGRNKRHAALQERLSRCQSGSRHTKRLLKHKAQISAKLYRQQRDILHQAARKVVDFCHAEGVSQWPHGQFARYLKEKAARLGTGVEWLDEAYSTKTYSQCSHVLPFSPRGRRFRCSGCGVRIHRDVNGSSNICARAAHGSYGQIQAETVKYLRPIGVAPRHLP